MLALRSGILAAPVLCAWIAGPAADARLSAALTVDFGALLGSPSAPPAVTAWVTPPSYTGRPPVLLPLHEVALTVPNGSRLTVSVSGLSRAPTLAGLPARFQRLDAHSFQLESTLRQSGLFVLRGRGEGLARWQIMVQPDGPPSIAFTGRPGPDADGFSLRVPWRATDDYGIVSAQLTGHLVGNPAAPALSRPLTLPSGPQPTVSGVQVTDLSANPWAGLPVSLQLAARNAAGRQGLSPVETVVLPERHFMDADARRVIAIRKSLVQMPSLADVSLRVPIIKTMLDAAAAASLDGKPANATLPLFASSWQLLYDGSPGAVSGVVDTLWQVALHFEQGDAADTGQSLMQAEQALQKALQGQGASSADLMRLMQQMQSAILQHLSALMQMAQHQGGTVQAGSAGKPFDLGALARALQDMEAAAKAGDLAGMRAAMAALQQSLQQLAEARIVKPDPKQEAARAQAERDLAQLQAMMKSEAGLLDRATGRAEGGVVNPAAQQKDAAAEAGLERAATGLPGRAGAMLTGAAQAMGQAVQQLGQGQDGQAARAEAQALHALQQAANALGQQLSAPSGQGGGFVIGNGPGSDNPGGLPQDGFVPGDGMSDPLGRPLSNGQGVSFGADIALPGSAQQAELRQILQELRAKAGDRSLSPAELDYIERLLQPF